MTHGNIRLEGDTRAALNKIRGLAEMDRKSLNAALGQGVRTSTLERFRTGKGPDGQTLAHIQTGTCRGRQDTGGLPDSCATAFRSDPTPPASPWAPNVKHASTHQ